MSRGDRLFDISVRVLMLAVSAALLGCIALLTWRWNQPPAGSTAVVPVTEVAPKAENVDRATVATVSESQVLLAPGRVYKCEIGGKVTFTDRPCPTATR